MPIEESRGIGQRLAYRIILDLRDAETHLVKEASHDRNPLCLSAGSSSTGVGDVEVGGTGSESTYLVRM